MGYKIQTSLDFERWKRGSFANSLDFKWHLTSGSPTIWNPDKWLPFCQKLLEIQTKTSRFQMVQFSNGWDYRWKVLFLGSVFAGWFLTELCLYIATPKPDFGFSFLDAIQVSDRFLNKWPNMYVTVGTDNCPLEYAFKCYLGMGKRKRKTCS